MSNIKKKIQRAKYIKTREKTNKRTHLLILKQVEKLITKSSNIEKNLFHVGIYWPLKGEIDLRPLKNSLNTPIALPCCNQNGSISYRPWLSGPLKKDAAGIPAPLQERELKPSEISLLLIPAVAIDYHGIRLGYGGGYFDKLRSDPVWESIASFVVLPKACISRTPLPKDPWDIPFRRWITEDGEYKTI